MYLIVVKGRYPVTDQRNVTVGRMAASPSLNVEVPPSTISQHQPLLEYYRGIFLPPSSYCLALEAVVELPWS
jgi:hypothetical protein